MPPRREELLQVTPLIRERIKFLRDVTSAADFFFLAQLPPYDYLELIPQKGDRALACRILTEARQLLAATAFDHASLESVLRSAAGRLGLKAGPIVPAHPGRRVRTQVCATIV